MTTGSNPAPARVFGDYHLLGLLGEGGMGSIHLARRAAARPELAPLCVVKRLRRELAKQASFVRRFRDEARVVVTLRHPALCHVFDVGLVGDEHYLAMELVEGVGLRTLQDAAAAAGERLEPAVALAIVDAVLDALAYAHELVDAVTGEPLRIVHRDVSPQNILLTFQGGTKLIDFGVVTSALREERTTAGVVVGKLSYMSPEQARGEEVDARTDVYATAIVLWELLSGRRFYGALTKNRIVMELTEGTWVPDLGDIPEALRAPLARALAPEPAARTPSAMVFAHELAVAAQTLGRDRASPRDLRAVVQRLCANDEARLRAQLRAAHAIRIATAAAPAEHTVVTTLAQSVATTSPLGPPEAGDDEDTTTGSSPTAAIARREPHAPDDASDDSDDDSDDDADEANPDEAPGHRTRRPRSTTPTSSDRARPRVHSGVRTGAVAAALTTTAERRAVAAGIALAFFLVVVVGLVVGMTARDQPPSAIVPATPAPPLTPTTAVTTPTATGAAGTTALTAPVAGATADALAADELPAGSDDVRGDGEHRRNNAGNGDAGNDDAGNDDAGNDDAGNDADGINARRPTRPRSPLPPFPGRDLGAQLDYLEQHCRVRTCTRPLLDARARIPLLDAAGLKALRAGAARCVELCRR